MKFVSIDIETTGLDSDNDQILEFAAIVVDTKTNPDTWPSMSVIIDHQRVSGNAVALSMHSRILKEIAQSRKLPSLGSNVYHPKLLFGLFYSFLYAHIPHGKEKISITVAGKNPSGFDIPFIKQHFNKHCDSNYTSVNDDPNNEQVINFRRRVIDPAVPYVDWDKDEILPDLAECKRRSGMNERVAHTALEDAMDVAMLIYKKVHGKDNP